MLFMAEIGIFFLELISINAQNHNNYIVKRVGRYCWLIGATHTLLPFHCRCEGKKIRMPVFHTTTTTTTSVQDKLPFHVFIGCWFKKKGSKKLETFIYYVVGRSIMKQLLDANESPTTAQKRCETGGRRQT